MKNFIKNLYFHSNFYISLLVIGLLFITSFFINSIEFIANISLIILLFFVILNLYLLHGINSKNKLLIERIVPGKLSNGDDNLIELDIKYNDFVTIEIEIIDEIPIKFQKRDFSLKLKLNPKENKKISYNLHPTERGIYHFGKLHAYIKTPYNPLIIKRISFDLEENCVVYPSIIQMKKYEMLAFSKHSGFGFQKVRRIGHTMEFDHIREYVQGNDIRLINWKASSKLNKLMVNHFQDEKSQPIYIILDKGKNMQMPFEGLSLLDYSINSALALSNIIIKKQDKIGLFTFSKTIENVVPAQNSSSQMQKIIETLYSINTDFKESDFSNLHANINNNIKQRSIIILFTNFETENSLNRQLAYLKSIAKKHLLIVVFFKNSEVDKLINRPTNSKIEIYDKVVAEKFNFEKKLIVQKLSKIGIISILTYPKDLSSETINKYLEIKARGLS